MLGCTGVNLQSPASRSKLRPPQNLTNFAAVSPREPPAVYAVADDVSDGCTGVNLQSCRRLVVADGTTASAPPAHASPRGLNTRGPATFGRLPRLMSQGDGKPRCTGVNLQSGRDPVCLKLAVVPGNRLNPSDGPTSPVVTAEVHAFAPPPAGAMTGEGLTLHEGGLRAQSTRVSSGSVACVTAVHRGAYWRRRSRSERSESHLRSWDRRTGDQGHRDRCPSDQSRP